MNIDTLRSAVLPSILGLAVSAVVASASVSAEEKEMILHGYGKRPYHLILDETYHDYSSKEAAAFYEVEESGPQQKARFYGKRPYHLILDETYHDYSSKEAAAFYEVEESGPQQKARFYGKGPYHPLLDETYHDYSSKEAAAFNEIEEPGP